MLLGQLLNSFSPPDLIDGSAKILFLRSLALDTYNSIKLSLTLAKPDRPVRAAYVRCQSDGKNDRDETWLSVPSQAPIRLRYLLLDINLLVMPRIAWIIASRW